MAARRTAHLHTYTGGPLDREVMAELRLVPDRHERAQQGVVTNQRAVTNFHPRVDDRPRTHNHLPAEHGAGTCAGVDVPDRVAALGPSYQRVLFHAGARSE